MTNRNEELLEKYLRSGRKIAERLATSMERVAAIFPLDARAMADLTTEDDERLDAFLFRFSSLAASVQDQVGRTLLLVEEEDLSTASRRDQRLLLERLGAIDEGMKFGVVAELRNRLAHSYPDEPEKQAEVLTLAKDKARDLIAAYNGMLAFASRHRIGIDLSEVAAPEDSGPRP